MSDLNYVADKVLITTRLSYYERNYEFLSQKELISQVQSHYTGQALKQLYVLVLGLDVIGNPYGLVVGLKKGVEDLFYEPFQVKHVAFVLLFYFYLSIHYTLNLV